MRNVEMHALLLSAHSAGAHDAEAGLPVRLSFVFHTSKLDRAQALRADLAQDHDVEVRRSSRSRLFARQWSVVGSTRPRPVSPEFLLEWVKWMSNTAAEYGCAFDGWSPVPEKGI